MFYLKYVNYQFIMKTLSKLLLSVAVILPLTSCMARERSTATFTQGVSFETNDVTFDDLFKDGLMFTPTISFDDLIFFPPDKNKVFFVAEVVPLNAWESAYYWHRYNELPARWQTALEEEHARLDADA